MRVQMLRVLPPHSTFSAGFSRIKNRYLFINSCSQIRPPPPPLKKTVEGVVVGGSCRPRSVFASRDPFPNNPVGEGSNPFLLLTVIPQKKNKNKNKAVSGDGFRSPCAQPAPARRGPGAVASHDAGLDVLVGDLLVVVGAATGRVHGRGCHGVEREDELLSVTHAGRLRVIPRDACGGEARGKGALKGGLRRPGLQVEKHRHCGARPGDRPARLGAGPRPPHVPVPGFRSQSGRHPEGRFPRHGQGSLQPWVPAAPASPSVDTEPGLGGFWWQMGKG